MVTSILKTNNNNTVGNVKPGVLWHIMKNQVSFIRYLNFFSFMFQFPTLSTNEWLMGCRRYTVPLNMENA